jgi:hypothetical protein
MRPEGLSLKNSSDSIGNQTSDLSACSAVPQPTALPRTPNGFSYMCEFRPPGQTGGARALPIR